MYTNSLKNDIILENTWSLSCWTRIRL